MPLLTREVVLMVVLGVCLLTGLSAAEAAITVKSATVVNGVAVVDGRAEADATLTWEGAAVTLANRGGHFAFQGVVPSDCVGMLSDGTGTIAVALANCVPASQPVGQVRKTGQTTCWDSSGAPITCAGTGQDGELQKGLVRSYTDNGDGTITDNTTGLMWEKLIDDRSSIHDVLNTCGGPLSSWEGAFGRIATLNAENFAGHNDWRLPNVNELQSLVNYGTHPAIDPAFNNPETHSFTAFAAADPISPSPAYWSSTTYHGWPLFAWSVSFNNGYTFTSVSSDKPDGLCSRAVRGPK